MPVPSLLSTTFPAYAGGEHSVKRPKRRTKDLAQRCCAGQAFPRSWVLSPGVNITRINRGQSQALGGYPTETLTAWSLMVQQYPDYCLQRCSFPILTVYPTFLEGRVLIPG